MTVQYHIEYHNRYTICGVLQPCSFMYSLVLIRHPPSTSSVAHRLATSTASFYRLDHSVSTRQFVFSNDSTRSLARLELDRSLSGAVRTHLCSLL